MRIEIDPRAPHPPSEQIADQVRFAIASGRIAPGDRLPSVRGLAADALVNPNTVGKAYRDLEREGVLQTRPGDGVFVAANARARCVAKRDRALAERLERVVREALAGGLGPQDIVAWVEKSLERRGAGAGGMR
jgi:GntR family transcriptional regulator